MAAESKSPDTLPFLDPRTFGLFKAAYSVKETLALLSIGRTSFYQLVDRNELKITKLGRKSLVCATDIVALLARLRGNSAKI
jgi:excisionase family DNA binding protein